MLSQNKLLMGISAVILVALNAPQALAQIGEQPNELQAIYQCKSIADSMKRLECYDNSVGRFQAAEKSGAVLTVSKADIENVERDAFGFNIPSLPKLGRIFGGGKNKDAQKIVKESDLTAPVKSAEVKRPSTPTAAPALNKDIVVNEVSNISLEVRKMTEFGYKKTRFFMKNGQVWETTGTTRIRVPKKKDGPIIAEISKAALGSFVLQLNGKGSDIRVKRVR